MPECVEVETTRRQLMKLLAGQTLRGVTIKDSLLGKANGFQGKLEMIERHGKILWFCLGGGKTFGLRLSMSGCLLTQKAFERFPKTYERMVMDFHSVQIVLMDPRRFAKLLGPAEPSQKGWDILSSIGESALPEVFENILLESGGAIRNLLLNQSKVAGLGNVYTNEILFAAKISPWRRGCALKSWESRVLWDAAVAILKRALELGGISMRNYFHPNGDRGMFQNEFQIYGKRKGSRCPRCKAPIQVIRSLQRSSFYCGKCQR